MADFVLQNQAKESQYRENSSSNYFQHSSCLPATGCWIFFLSLSDRLYGPTNFVAWPLTGCSSQGTQLSQHSISSIPAGRPAGDYLASYNRISVRLASHIPLFFRRENPPPPPPLFSFTPTIEAAAILGKGRFWATQEGIYRRRE